MIIKIKKLRGRGGIFSLLLLFKGEFYGSRYAYSYYRVRWNLYSREIIVRAIKNNVIALAITDHDTVLEWRKEKR